jgi:hypothetical protein
MLMAPALMERFRPGLQEVAGHMAVRKKSHGHMGVMRGPSAPLCTPRAPSAVHTLRTHCSAPLHAHSSGALCIHWLPCACAHYRASPCAPCAPVSLARCAPRAARALCAQGCPHLARPLMAPTPAQQKRTNLFRRPT